MDNKASIENKEKQLPTTKVQHKPRAPSILPEESQVLWDLRFLVESNPNASHLKPDLKDLEDFVFKNFMKPGFDKQQLLTKAQELMKDCETATNAEKVQLIKTAVSELDRALVLEPLDANIWECLLSIIDNNIELLGSRRKTARISLLKKYLHKFKPTEQIDLDLICREACNLSQLHLEDGNFDGAAGTLSQVLSIIDTETEGYQQVLEKWFQVQNLKIRLPTC